MTTSGYQVQRLIARLRDWLGAEQSAQPAPPDPVRLSGAGRREAASGGGRPPSAVRSGLWEQQERPPAVERERERRAGSFMRPPYPDPPSPSHIPKLRKAAQDSGASASTSTAADSQRDAAPDAREPTVEDGGSKTEV